MLATLVLGAPVVNVSSSVVIQSLPILGPVFATIDETIHSSDALVLKAAADLSGAEDQFARDLFAEHNIARTTPSVYANTLAQLLPYFRSATVLDLPGRTDLRMEEGKAAFEEAINFLREQRPRAADDPLQRPHAGGAGPRRGLENVGARLAHGERDTAPSARLGPPPRYRRKPAHTRHRSYYNTGPSVGLY